jgi:crotonobetaine/carnitine-CoA ligase
VPEGATRVSEAALTIPDLFESARERAASKTWLRYEDSAYTYQQAHERIVSAASALAGLGVGRQSHVLATTRNSPEYLVTWLALMRLGAVLVPVNPQSSKAELAGFAKQVFPELVVTDRELRVVVEDAVREAAPGARIALAEDLVNDSGEEVPALARPDDVAVMIPTSGTTGRSKLVMQTQRAYAMAGEGFPFWMGLTEDDRLMTSLPLFHINAPAYSTLGSVAAGAGLVLLPRFSASRFIDWARRYGATEFNAIGAMLEILMRQPERDDDADNPLRLCYTGPAPAKQRQLEIESRFGLEIICGYALSETPYGLIWRRGTRPYGTLGSVRQHPTLGVVNEARVMREGREASIGEVGELELKNPAVMHGYFGMPEETEKVLSNGWLRTGDLVEVKEDGIYTFVGRKKELIRRRGENLSPLEVEAALEEHPAVAEAAVIGVPSELSEEEIKAFVSLGNDADITMTELRDFVAERLAPFKVPRYFEVVSELPHTPTGRVAKHELSSERSESEEDLAPQPATSKDPR